MLEVNKIIISSVEEKKTIYGTVVNIVDKNGVKYKFWEKKKSTGTLTAAWQGYSTGLIKPGVEVEVGINEVDKVFVKDGRNIKYKDRYISFFNTDELTDKLTDKLTEKEETDISNVPF